MTPYPPCSTTLTATKKPQRTNLYFGFGGRTAHLHNSASRWELSEETPPRSATTRLTSYHMLQTNPPHAETKAITLISTLHRHRFIYLFICFCFFPSLIFVFTLYPSLILLLIGHTVAVYFVEVCLARITRQITHVIYWWMQAAKLALNKPVRMQI